MIHPTSGGLVLLLMSILAGCSVYQSPQEITYYTLHPSTQPSAPNAAYRRLKAATTETHTQQYRARVTRVSVASFLSQPSMVVENADHTLSVANYHHWAELPHAAIQRYLDQCLRQHPLPHHPKGLELSVEIDQFHRLGNADVSTSGYWRAYDRHSTRLVKEHHFSFLEGQKRDGYHGISEALSNNLEALCLDMRKTLDKTPPRR